VFQLVGYYVASSFVQNNGNRLYNECDLRQVVDRVRMMAQFPIQQPHCSNTEPWSDWLVAAQRTGRSWTPGNRTTHVYLQYTVHRQRCKHGWQWASN